MQRRGISAKGRNDSKAIGPGRTERRPTPAKIGPRAERRPAPPGIRHLPLKLGLLGVLLGLPLWGSLTLLAQGNPLPVAAYAGASLLAVLLYRHDKRSAQQARQRVPEKKLHLVELAGGWPGALLAQQAFRHKTRKAGFQGMFWMIVLAHQAAWVDYLLLHRLLGGAGLP